MVHKSNTHTNSSGGVSTIDGISGAVSLVAGTNITISDNAPIAGSITISASGGGGANALPYSAITGTTTSAGTEQVIEATSGTFVLTLTNPTVSAGKAFPLWISNSGSGVVTIAATYAGGTSFTLAPQSSVLYIFNGTSWLVF